MAHRLHGADVETELRLMMSQVIANVVRVFGILFCYIFPWYFPWYFTLAIGYLVSLLNSSVATNSQQQCAIQLGGTCRVTYCDLSHAGCWLTIQDTTGTVFFDLFIENKYLHLFSARRFAMSHIIQKYPTHLHFVNSFTSTLSLRLTRDTMRTQPTLTTISIPPNSRSLLTSIYTIRTRYGAPFVHLSFNTKKLA